MRQLLTSTVLCPAGLPSCRLQLWHRSNWHWYLKSERRFEMCEGLAIQWDDLAARRLHILTSDGDYLQVRPGTARMGP